MTEFALNAKSVVDALSGVDLPFVGTKGVTFESSLYLGNGSRNLDTEIDFMIPPEFREKVSERMLHSGFISGFYHAKSNRVLPHPRKEIITYKLNPDHLPPFTMLTGDAIFSAVSIDFSHSFTWARSEYEIPINETFSLRQFRPIPSSTLKLPRLSEEYAFVFTVLHLFRAAWFERWIDFEQDVNLAKFEDVIRLLKANEPVHRDRQFLALLKRYKIEMAMSWVLEHLDHVFSLDIVEAIGLSDRVNEEWFFSGHSPDGKPRVWKGSMKQRLFYKDVRNLFN